MRRVVMAWGIVLVGVAVLGVGVRTTLAARHERESSELLGRIDAVKSRELVVQRELAAARAERQRAAAQLEQAWEAHLAKLRKDEPPASEVRRGRQSYYRRRWESHVADATRSLECLRVGYEFVQQPPNLAFELEPAEDDPVWQ